MKRKRYSTEQIVAAMRALRGIRVHDSRLAPTGDPVLLSAASRRNTVGGCDGDPPNEPGVADRVVAG